MAVLPSADSATEKPWKAPPTAPVPTSLPPCWLHTPPLRVNTNAAPALLLSFGPPAMAVLPSAEIATELPIVVAGVLKRGVTFCCWLHVPPRRMKNRAAPAVVSPGPPAMAVLPPAETATELPWLAFAIAPLADQLVSQLREIRQRRWRRPDEHSG